MGTITRDASSALSEEEIERMVREAEEFAEENKLAKERIEGRNKLEGYAYQLKNLVGDEEKSASISDEDKEAIETAADEAIEFLESNPDASNDEIAEAHAALEQVAQPIVGACTRTRKVATKAAKKKRWVI